MATVNLAKKPALQPLLNNLKFSDEVLIDFAAMNVAASDVVQVYNVAEGCIVESVKLMVVVAEGGTCTIDIGDGDGTNSWDATVSINATAKTITASASGTDAYATANGKYYASADTIDFVMGHAADAAKVLLIVEGHFVQNSTVISTL